MSYDHFPQQSVEQILVSPDGSKLVTLGSTGSSSGTFGVFRLVANSACEAFSWLRCKDNRCGVRKLFIYWTSV